MTRHTQASRHVRDITIHNTKADAGTLGRFGIRRCYRAANTFHTVSNLACDCLRAELPVEARAKSSGALATPGSAGRSDRSIRRELSEKRATGKLGVK